MYQNALTLRMIGFLASLLLTFAVYFIIMRPDFFNLDSGKAILVVFTFAILQSIVQLIFFLDLFGEKGTRWNLVVFISTFFIIVTIIFFSIWIMHHLDYNMMPRIG